MGRHRGAAGRACCVLCALLPVLTGCPTQELRKFMNSPAVQDSIKDWQTSGEFDNPIIYGEVAQAFRIGVTGIEGEMEARGEAGPHTGLNVENLAKLHEIADRYGIDTDGLTPQDIFDAVVDLLRPTEFDTDPESVPE